MLSSRRYVLLLIFLLYVGSYVAVNYPAVAHAWWYRDDFPLTETPRPNKGQLDTLKHGRPVNYLLLATYQWEVGKQWAFANRSLRLLQILLHALAALVAGAILSRKLHDWSSYGAVLIFLLYPFNGEAVLWRSAAMNPLAALFSLLGVWLLNHASRPLESAPPVTGVSSSINDHQRWLNIGGISLIALAMLTHQQAGLAGLVVWVLRIALQAFQAQCYQASWLRTSRWVLGGYILGTGLSRFCIYLFFGPAGRAAFSSEWLSKVELAITLNRLYLLSDYYPRWLAALHLLMVVGGIGVVGLHLASRQWRGLGRIALVAFISLLILPYAAVLITAENWPAWRITYVAPFVVVGAWLFLDRSLAVPASGRLLNVLLLGLLLFGYSSIAWTNAAEYVYVFEQDLLEAKKLEAWAAAQREAGTTVVVATAPDYVRSWNPYGIQYMQADSKVSAFLADWTIAPLLAFFTDLTAQQQSDAKQACVEFCLLPSEPQPFTYQLLPQYNTICVCP